MSDKTAACARDWFLMLASLAGAARQLSKALWNGNIRVFRSPQHAAKLLAGYPHGPETSAGSSGPRQAFRIGEPNAVDADT